MKGYSYFKILVTLWALSMQFVPSYGSISLVSVPKNLLQMTDSDTSQLLCRKWEMVKEHAGVDSLVAVERSWVTFYQDGTYLVQVLPAGESQTINASKVNWKWATGRHERILRWYPQQEVDDNENENYIIIREIGESSLKLSQNTWQGLLDFSFVPAN